MPPAPEVALQQSDAVFEGKVLAISDDPSRHRLTATLAVTRVWKGELGSRAKVTTGDMDSMCGYSFAVGTSYVVYASGERTGLSTELCTRTKLSFAAKDDLAALGARQGAVGGWAGGAGGAGCTGGAGRGEGLRGGWGWRGRARMARVARSAASAFRRPLNRAPRGAARLRPGCDTQTIAC